jgi:hypothetical protein
MRTTKQLYLESLIRKIIKEENETPKTAADIIDTYKELKTVPYFKIPELCTMEGQEARCIIELQSLWNKSSNGIVKKVIPDVILQLNKMAQED